MQYIRDRSDSEVFYEFGRNWMHFDTCRWRHDPLFRCGPQEKIKHYLPLYAKVAGELTHEEKKALPCSSIILKDEAPLTSMKIEQRHVIPRPLLEKIVAISGIGRNPDPKLWYYRSDIREQWAVCQLQNAEKAATSGLFAKAAEYYAEVFGTLIPGMICKKNTEIEAACAEKAWKGLTFFIEPMLVMSHLHEASKCEMTKREEAAGIKTLGDVISLAKKKFFRTPIGPKSLEIAEELAEIEKTITDLEVKLKMPRSGYFVRDVKSLPVGHGLRIRMLSQIIKYTAWAWDYADDTATLFSFPKSFLSFYRKKEEAKTHLILVSRDAIGLHYRLKGEMPFSDRQKEAIKSLPRDFVLLRKIVEERHKNAKKLDGLRHRQMKLMADIGSCC